MKIISSICFILLIKLSFAQQYDGLYLEKCKVDQNNNIYTLGKAFVYQVQIFKDDEPLYLKENTADYFELTNNKDSLKISEIFINLIQPRLFQRTNTKQTEVFYSYAYNPTTLYATGFVENNFNTWIHPPRNGFFKALETCPFPYVKSNKPIGYQWADSMRIGNHWAHNMWGEWEGELLLTYAYKRIENERIVTALGEIDCQVIQATAHATLGRTSLKAYFSEQYGFLKLEYTLFNGIEIDLMCVAINEGPILRDGKDFFENKNKQ